MTDQEAIEKIECAKAEVEWNYPLDYAVAFDMAIEALEEQGKHRWIPVSERLPKDLDADVLVQASGKYRNIHFNNAFLLGNYSKACGWIIEGYEEWIDPNVIAWMPLPEPYKESEEGQAHEKRGN